MISKAMQMKARPIATEAQEQTALFKWAEFNARVIPELTLLFHIPNGGKRDVITASRLKAQGVKSGVPDLFLPVPRGSYHGLFVEMKKIGGTISDKQGEWIPALAAQGYKTVVCQGWVEAADMIKRYLNPLKAKINRRRKYITEQQTAILKNAIKTYGADNQLNIAIEELSELIKAICKYKRAKGKQRTIETDQIHEEIADVSIMLEQILMIIGNREQAIIYIDRKIQRLADILDSEREVPQCLS